MVNTGVHESEARDKNSDQVSLFRLRARFLEPIEDSETMRKMQVPVLGSAKDKMNETELQVAEQLKSEGWRVLRGGWPDFLCVRGSEIKCVEVKSAGDWVNIRQRELHDVLKEHGLIVEVLPIRTRSTEVLDIPILRCWYCEHKWYPRTSEPPKVCPKCKRDDWDKERRHEK